MRPREVKFARQLPESTFKDHNAHTVINYPGG